MINKKVAAIILFSAGFGLMGCLESPYGIGTVNAPYSREYQLKEQAHIRKYGRPENLETYKQNEQAQIEFESHYSPGELRYMNERRDRDEDFAREHGYERNSQRDLEAQSDARHRHEQFVQAEREADAARARAEQERERLSREEYKRNHPRPKLWGFIPGPEDW